MSIDSVLSTLIGCFILVSIAIFLYTLVLLFFAKDSLILRKKLVILTLYFFPISPIIIYFSRPLVNNFYWSVVFYNDISMTITLYLLIFPLLCSVYLV